MNQTQKTESSIVEAENGIYCSLHSSVLLQLSAGAALPQPGECKYILTAECNVR